MESHGSQGRPLRVCYFGTYRADYSRTQILLKGLRSRPDVEVVECHAKLWDGIEDREGGIQTKEKESRSPRKNRSFPPGLKPGSLWKRFEKKRQGPNWRLATTCTPT